MSYLDDEKSFGNVNSGNNMRLNHPDDLKKYFSSKTFKDFLADKASPLVYCTLSLDGKPFLDKSGFSINLNQHTNDHDNFTIVVPDDALDSFQGYVMENSKNILGKNITINLHRFGDVRQVFNGVVANVKNKKENGYGKLYISGYAPSILLENGKDCQSFEDKTLEQIIKSATSDYPENCKVLVESPNTKYALPYTVQYKESDYQFIKRLATRFGEYFYYNGQNMVFGNKVQPIVNLEENIDLIEVEVEMNIKPQDFNYSVFDVQGGSKSDKDSSSAQVHYKENPFQAIAITASKSVYKKKPEMLFNHTGISDSTDRELKEAVRREKENRENLVTVKGKSKDPELKIGGRAKLIDINGKAMETYRIIEIKHYHDGNTYYNEFVGIPDLFNAPYQDEEAVPLGEKQSARVLDNDDPSGMGRVRVQFPWQEKKGEKSPWIRVIQPHSGSGKGFHFIPEIGEEVLVDFESGNAEKPFVVGTQYNGSETSSYHTSGNDLKVTKTRSGHTIIMDDSEDKMSITILDISGNTIYLDTVKKSITIKAPETIDIICKNLNIKVEENMKTTVGHNQENMIGKNIKIIAKEEISQNSGKKTIIASGDNTEISSKKDLDLYGKKNLIGFTDGKTEFGAKEQMHIYGASSLITAKDKIEYKAPQMNKLAESGKFKHDKEKQILSVQWMDAEMKENIENANIGEKVSLLVQTRNYEEGEAITVIIDDENGKDVRDGEKELTLTGTVNKEGFAELKEKVEIEKLKEEDKQNHSSQGESSTHEDENSIYKSYEGKGYTKSEWKIFEDEQYKIYMEKKNKRGFLG
ncbi:type VI secretion system tip protein VgrG [Chryseobacterium sp. PBS4-4]|uniref:Type VI secretion system tip protein VgrG n=1 Tax=Chryseobacterium edaphi TaxID=2976532 RepID=A0ABT2WBS9_9FLAO|nr:type VI secretion system tip protein VgrG [Chryseobacterium edaphi]MCU7618752.1 type VI secretion system tip protein VgrG [Chryseobacterium edaphi]